MPKQLLDVHELNAQALREATRKYYQNSKVFLATHLIFTLEDETDARKIREALCDNLREEFEAFPPGAVRNAVKRWGEPDFQRPFMLEGDTVTVKGGFVYAGLPSVCIFGFPSAWPLSNRRSVPDLYLAFPFRVAEPVAMCMDSDFLVPG